MKTFINFSLFLMTTALVLTSCNNSDDIAPDTSETGAQATMTILFDNPATRGVGSSINENLITGGTVMVFRNGSGILDGMATFSSAATATRVKITAGVRDVYVVANTGLDFSAVQNVTDLKNMTTKYGLSTISHTGTSLPMSGTALTQDATAATTASPKAVSVTMQYMCSKVTIAWDRTLLNPNMSSFVVTGAYVMNVPTATDCFAFGADNLTTYVNAFGTGLSTFASFASGAYYPVTPYTNVFVDSLNLASPAANSGNNFFYVFENKVAASPTIVVIQGIVTDFGVPTTYYYPIVINGTQNTTSGDGTSTVIHGNHYTVIAKIKGFGNTNPYAPIVNAAMDVTIVPATWTPVLINQTFE